MSTDVGVCLGSAETIDYAPKEEVRRVLSQYLSGLTLTKDDAFGLRLPENEIPKGFHLIHNRSSKRTVYTTKPGFSIVLSKECSWRNEGAEHRPKESVIIWKKGISVTKMQYI